MQLANFENDVRFAVYKHYVSECRASAAFDVAQALDAEPEKVRSAFRPLAIAWYHDRLEPSWRCKTIDEARQLFAELGMTAPFWELGA